MSFLFAALAILLSTLLGIVLGTLLKALSHRANDLLLALAAGMMLGASVVGLILPALDATAVYAKALTLVGVFAGAIVASLIDIVVPHLHKFAGLEMTATDRRAHHVLLFVAAIALHKFPEGIAAGVSLGTGNPGDAVTVVGSIALQNIPEAFVVVAPLLAIGVTRLRTLVIACVIGGVSLVGLFLGNVLMFVAAPLSPFLLAFAGGAMMYVVSDEMIPETHHAYETAATFALLAGFMLILLVSRCF